jgi:hypothetical protein
VKARAVKASSLVPAAGPDPSVEIVYAPTPDPALVRRARLALAELLDLPNPKRPRSR